VGRPCLLAVACALCVACAEPAAPPFAPLSRDAGHGEPETPLDAAILPPAGPTLPSVEPAQRASDARGEAKCAAVPGVTGFYTPPSLHAIGDSVYVFSVDASEPVPQVLVHVSGLDPLDFGEPSTLLYGAHEVDLIAQGDQLRALAARQFYAVEMVSSDGLTFEESQQVGPHEPTYDCEGYPPARYFRGRDPVQMLVVGSDYNTGLFGCYERVFVGRRQGNAWAEPVEVGRGDAIFAYQGQAMSTLVTSLGVLQSADDGQTWSPVAGLMAAGGAFTGERLLLIRLVGEGVAVLESRDQGETWTRQIGVLEDVAYGGAFIAADGPHVSVAVATAQELVLSTSDDDAETWTDPKRLPRPDRVLALAQHGTATLWLTAGADDALELCVLR